MVGKLHTDCTPGTEGPARQSGRLACLGELVSLKVDKVTLWAKEGNRQGEKPPEDKSGAFLSDILLSKWGFDANTQTPHIAVGFLFVCFVFFSAHFQLLTEEGRIRKKGKTKPATQIPLLAAPVNVLTENDPVEFEALGSMKHYTWIFWGFQVTPEPRESSTHSTSVASTALAPWRLPSKHPLAHPDHLHLASITPVHPLAGSRFSNSLA